MYGYSIFKDDPFRPLSLLRFRALIRRSHISSYKVPSIRRYRLGTALTDIPRLLAAARYISG